MVNGDPWAWTETFSRTGKPQCICGPLASSDGEDIDVRPGCPQHGLDATRFREWVNLVNERFPPKPLHIPPADW